MKESSPNVLVVDDVEANLVALEAVLANVDCRLVRASSGNEALRLLLKHEFAAIILDVQMPDMDGFEVARLARSNPAVARVPIIFVTAMHDSPENVLRGYETGAVDLLFKPVNGYVLESKVRAFLELYCSRRDLSREVEAHERTLADLKAFNYSVAHDLRAPLRALEGFSRILLEEHGDELSDDPKNLTRRINAAAKRMGQLIDDLLRLSQIGRAAVRLERVDVGGLVAAIVSELRRESPDRQVDVAVTTPLEASADSALLGILLENLVRNAWKFTGKRARAVIEVGARTERGERVYFVKDDGVGFDPAHAGQLFRPFQRLHAPSEFAGTGIGLAIVRRIVDHHGGRIWAESKPGDGATFLFTLAPAPRANAAAPPSAAERR